MDGQDFSANLNAPTYCSGHETDVSTRPELHCQYAGRLCQRPRAVKLNGELHRMCQHHRMRANTNQRRSQRRHRQRFSNNSDGSNASHCSTTNTHSDVIPTEKTPFPVNTIATKINSVWSTFSTSIEEIIVSLFGRPTPPEPDVSIAPGCSWFDNNWSWLNSEQQTDKSPPVPGAIPIPTPSFKPIPDQTPFYDIRSELPDCDADLDELWKELDEGTLIFPLSF